MTVQGARAALAPRARHGPRAVDRRRPRLRRDLRLPAGMLCALVPGSMLLIASATIVARNVYRGLNPHASDATVTTLTKLLVPVVALGAVAFVFAGGQSGRRAAVRAARRAGAAGIGAGLRRPGAGGVRVASPAT